MELEKASVYGKGHCLMVSLQDHFVCPPRRSGLRSSQAKIPGDDDADVHHVVVQRRTEWFNGPVGYLPCRRPHISAEMLIIDDDDDESIGDR